VGTADPERWALVRLSCGGYFPERARIRVTVCLQQSPRGLRVERPEMPGGSVCAPNGAGCVTLGKPQRLGPPHLYCPFLPPHTWADVKVRCWDTGGEQNIGPPVASEQVAVFLTYPMSTWWPF
jgi:hypothetical protein